MLHSWVRAARGAVLAVACLLVAPVFPTTHAATRSVASPAAPAAAATSFAPSPGFEENRGQSDPRVRFVRRGANASVFLTQTEAVTALDSGDVVRMRFAGANPSADVGGETRRPETANFLRGSRSISDVPVYSAVRYRDLYPGVDFVMYESGPGLEYDFVVQPGADASRVALDFGALAHAKIDADGSLAIATRDGAVRHGAPVAYQVVDGARRTIPCRFELDARGAARFVLGDHDASLPVVIDPVVTSSTYLGGTNVERAQAIARDSAGAIYLTGRTFSPDFPTVASYQDDIAGNYDIFVTKFSANTSTIVYSTYVGGANFETGLGIAVGAAGQAYVTGYTGSTDFPTSTPFQPSLSAGTDAIVFGLNAAGSSLDFSSYLGGNGVDEGHGIAVSAAGDVYVGGLTSSTNLATTVGAIQPAYGGGTHDAFYAKVSAGALSTLSYLGGVNDDVANAIALDSSANVYLTGFAAATFPLLTPFQASAGGTDAFVTKVNASLTTLAYSSFLGGSNTDIGTGIGVDPAGSAYVAGYTLSTNFPTLTPFQSVNAGNNDAFVTKVNPAGSSRVYSSYIGGSGDDRANAIAVDAYGSAYVVGQTRSSDFPTLFPVQATNGGNGLNDIFVTKVGASGRIRIYSTYFGGSSTDVAYGVAADASGTAYVAGYSESSNYPLVSPTQATNFGVDDVVFSLIFEPGDTPGAVTTADGWFLRNSSTSGGADISFTYGGNSTFVPLSGDWDGNGTDTPGLYDPSTGIFYLRNSSTAGAANITFAFGAGGNVYVPVTGDWNGDGVDSVGIYNPVTGVFFLKNVNAAGGADFSFTYGAPNSGFVPVTGDWNGDGIDTIGLFDRVNAAWFLRDANSAGGATYLFNYGAPGTTATPITGDWNADGVDTPGLFDSGSSAWLLKNTLGPGAADLAFNFGPPGSRPVVGDWNN